MPYLEIVLGNLHYYVDAMFDVLIEYYHMGIANNRIIFFDIEKEEILYWKNLGLDEKGKKVKEKEITQENYKKLYFLKFCKGSHHFACGLVVKFNSHHIIT